MGPSENEARSLVALARRGSTARLLNLAKGSTNRRFCTPPELLMFRNPFLDRALIVKHRLRMHERGWFVAPKTVSTKLLIPIDPTDFTCGAHALFVNQRSYDALLDKSLGVDGDPEAGERDRAVLAALDELPSLDPFLTREHLRRRGVPAADEYFDITPGDVVRMTRFVRAQIRPLVTLCFGGQQDDRQAEILTDKLLKAELDATMEPLRLTLKMTEVQFVEGVFCWKGFLYYKWALSEVLRDIGAVARSISTCEPCGEGTPDELAFIAAAGPRLRGSIKRVCLEVRDALQAYDAAFDKLTRHAAPVAFRDFLLAAPALFFEIGDKIGAVQHITSFGRFRLHADAREVSPAELFDILTDFEISLGGVVAPSAAWAA